MNWAHVVYFSLLEIRVLFLEQSDRLSGSPYYTYFWLPYFVGTLRSVRFVMALFVKTRPKPTVQGGGHAGH
jgi:hypothetical protein